MTNTKTDWFIIVNPRAGSGKTISGWTEAEGLLRRHGVTFTVEFTHYKSHARELAFQAARDGYRFLLAAGGDGSVHEMFSGILDYCSQTGTPPEEFRLGNIPIGSGNDWLKSVGVPHDMGVVVDLVADGVSRFQDVIEVKTGDGSVCCMANIGGVGFDSRVCERVNARKERGHRSRLIYVHALMRTIFTLKRINVSVSGDGELIYEGPCYSVAFGNGRYSGGGMLQTGAAVMDDGLLDVLVVPAMSLFRILREVHRIFDGTTHEASFLKYRKCRHLSMAPLDARSDAPVEVDGEIEGRIPIEIRVTGQSIGVVAPQATGSRD